MADSLVLTLTPIICFGEGMLAQLGRNATMFGAKRVLIVSDPGVNALGLPARIKELLAAAKIEAEVFLGVDPNPTEANIAAGTEIYRTAKCDTVLAVGGGSPLDAAKAIRITAKVGGKARDYNVTTGGSKRIPWDLPPMIAIPTTAGTGSEVTSAAVVSLPDEKLKISLVGSSLAPTLALVDPELTYGMPPALTAATGMDALAHCVESYSVPRYNPPADQLALSGVELVGLSLARAVADGRDQTARRDMAMAALLGGMSFPNKGIGAAHALSHALTAVCGLPHGLANAILMPPVMRLNAPSQPEKFKRLAELLTPGVPTPPPAADAVQALNDKIGIPRGLKEVKVEREQFPLLAAKAFQDVSLKGNPVKLDQNGLIKLLEEVY